MCLSTFSLKIPLTWDAACKLMEYYHPSFLPSIDDSKSPQVTVEVRISSQTWLPVPTVTIAMTITMTTIITMAMTGWLLLAPAHCTLQEDH